MSTLRVATLQTMGAQDVWSGPTTAGRPILVCVVAISSMTLIAITGLLTRTLTGELLVVILGFIAGIGGIGAGAHLAAAERARAGDTVSSVVKAMTQMLAANGGTKQPSGG